jgi:hypothetical protein
MSLKRLLVLTDYTLASSIAAEHCYQMASLGGAEVISLHVVSDKEDIAWAEKKSIDQVKNLSNYNDGVSFKPIVSSQNLFQGFNEWLERQEIGLTFMATHGKKDVQFITGSNALKLILNAESPTLVTQQKTQLKSYKKILFPVFEGQDEMEFPIAAFKSIVELFDSEITFIIPAMKDEVAQTNVHDQIEKLKKRIGIQESKSSIHLGTQSGSKFASEVIAFGQKENHDLISVIVAAKHHRKESDKAKKFYQTMITNEAALPVLCL